MQGIIDFLENKAIGKTLRTSELSYYLEDSQLEGVYSDQIAFSNLRYSKKLITMDMFAISSDKIYRLNPQGQRGEQIKDFSAVSLFRYELAKRDSGEVTGILRFISSTGQSAPCEAVVSGVHGLRLLDDRLSWRETQMLYRDQPGKDRENRQVAFDASNRLYMEKGRLYYAYEYTVFDVHPGSLHRRMSRDSFPPFVAIEII
ncbi:MAG: hypothetical protein ACOX88_05340 [Christensenellales bacterium]|jgi:hypothetical protein